MSKNPHIAMIGGGSWATALVKILTDNGVHVAWWIRNPENIDYIRKHRHNGRYLRAATLDLDFLSFYSDVNAALSSTDCAIFAVPAAFLRSSLQGVNRDWFAAGKVITAIKGIEIESQRIISDYFREEWGAADENIACIAGPCHAEEVAEELTAYLTIGTHNEALGTQIAGLLARPNIYTQTVADLDGVEYAAVLKNIYAVATGIAAGVGTGDNFRAVLVSSAAREMRTFLDKFVPLERDILHSVYNGDLLVTCYSQHSRNRMFGNMLGRGYGVRAAQLEMNMVAEGYYASKCIWDMTQKHQLEMPIADAVYRVLYEHVAPRLEFHLLKEKLQ